MKQTLKLLLLIVVIAGLTGLTEAQTKRKTKSRRARTARTATPQGVPIGTLEPEVVSRAGDEQNSTNNQNGATTTNNGAAINGGTSTTPQTRPNTARGGSKDEQAVSNLERLSRAEQAAQTLRSQLSGQIDKEAELQNKIEQLDLQMQPENIERDTAVIGSLRPEQVREARRKQLENEKTRAAQQLQQTQAARTRLEAAVANADALVDQLRARTSNTPASNQNRDNGNGSNNVPQPDNPSAPLPQ